MAEADWTQLASQDNALAVATRAAEQGARHAITRILASYSAAKVGLLQIKVAGVVVDEFYVNNCAVIDFTNGYRGGSNQAVSAELQASGVGGVLGKVSIGGYTR